MFIKHHSWFGSACAVTLIVLLATSTAGHAQPPGFPRMPNIPAPPIPGGGIGGMPGIPGGGIGGMPGMGQPEHIFTCSGCGKEVGRSNTPFKPEIANCPHCGVRFGNTTAGRIANSQDRMNDLANRTGGWTNGPGMPAPIAPAFPNGAASPPPPAPFTPNFPSPTPSPFGSSSSTAPSAKSGASVVLIWVLVGITGLLVMLAMIGGAIWLISTAPSFSASLSPNRRPSRRPARRRYADEY